jgi:hypothetical protein
MPSPRTQKTVSDTTIPDPDELDEREIGELNDMPLPERVRHDIHADNRPPEREVDLDDGIPSDDRKDAAQGDEGVDDPAKIHRRA